MDDEIDQLIAQLERVNSKDFDWSSEAQFPNFVTVRGGQCQALA